MGKFLRTPLPPLCSLALALSSFRTGVSFTCSLSQQCDPSKNPILFPTSFSVFGAWDGRQYVTGETALITARFSSTTCLLPEPSEAGPGCVPIMSIGLGSYDGSYCFSIAAANSTVNTQQTYGVRFISDPSLDTGAQPFNHWVFPLEVKQDMLAARLSIVGLYIPPACNIPGRATFSNQDLIPAGNTLLTPAVSINTFPARIVVVFSGKASGTYTYGDTINIIVEFSENVSFSELPDRYGAVFMSANASNTLPPGQPFLELNSQAFALLEGYDGTDKRRLSFIYNVGTGEFTPPGGQLEVPAGATIQLNGGGIVSLATSMEVNLSSMPAPGTPGEHPPFRAAAPQPARRSRPG